MQYLSQGGERRAPFRTLLAKIRRELPESAIFGGMIRDFGLGYARTFSSDIDIVSMASAKEIYEVIKPFDPVRNKFGGFRFCASERLFDIWSFHDTWAIREGLVPGDTLEDLCRTTFFTLDAAIFRLNQHCLVAAEDYEQNLRRRLLGGNLLHHPFPEKMAQRAVRMAVAKDLLMAPELCDFVVRYLYPSKSDDIYDRFVRRLRGHLRFNPEQYFKYKIQLSMWPDIDECSDSVPENSTTDSFLSMHVSTRECSGGVDSANLGVRGADPSWLKISKKKSSPTTRWLTEIGMDCMDGSRSVWKTPA